jgi:hypothetical protein
VLNVSDLARSLGVSSHTVDGDLDVLEQTFMIRRLRPYRANIQKRLTKSPKIYLRDTGLLHFLAGLREPADLETWARRGASFEGLVIEELIAAAADRAVRPEAWFWRTHAGAEVDLLLVHGRRILPVEVKLGASVGAPMWLACGVVWRTSPSAGRSSSIRVRSNEAWVVGSPSSHGPLSPEAASSFHCEAGWRAPEESNL